MKDEKTNEKLAEKKKQNPQTTDKQNTFEMTNFHSSAVFNETKLKRKTNGNRKVEMKLNFQHK